MKIRYLLGGACALLLLLPLRAVAENIGNVTPDEWDYGQVMLGESAIQSFTFESVGPVTPLVVTGIYMLDDSGAFEITSVTHVETGEELTPPYGDELEVGDHMEIVLAFTPTYVGFFDGNIMIMSNALNFYRYYIPLHGEGVPYEPGPGELMEDLIDAYEEGVESGAICGLGGSTGAVKAHLRVFSGMLDSADDLIALGDIDGACAQLDHAYLKCDGDIPPPDFIGCDAAGTINTMIGVVMETLGCD